MLLFLLLVVLSVPIIRGEEVCGIRDIIFSTEMLTLTILPPPPAPPPAPPRLGEVEDGGCMAQQTEPALYLTRAE